MSSNEQEASGQAPPAEEVAAASEGPARESPGPSPQPSPRKRGEGEARPAVEERVGHRRPPLATRFRPGQSGNPRGRPKRARHLGAVVAAALSERVAVTETDGRVRRLSKLEATVKQIVDGAAAGDARSTRLLFALIKADDRALNEPEGRRPDRLASEADAIVIAELRRRLTRNRPSGARRSRAKASGAS